MPAPFSAGKEAGIDGATISVFHIKFQHKIIFDRH